MARKVIITCAVTGSIHTPTMSPYLPITPQQIADDAIAAAEAGAAVLHLHARNPHSLYLGRGELARSNADQVRLMRGVLESLGLDIATPDEARAMLRLKGRASVRL